MEMTQGHRWCPFSKGSAQRDPSPVNLHSMSLEEPGKPLDCVWWRLGSLTHRDRGLQ